MVKYFWDCLYTECRFEMQITRKIKPELEPHRTDPDQRDTIRKIPLLTSLKTHRKNIKH